MNDCSVSDATDHVRIDLVSFSHELEAALCAGLGNLSLYTIEGKRTSDSLFIDYPLLAYIVLVHVVDNARCVLPTEWSCVDADR